MYSSIFDFCCSDLFAAAMVKSCSQANAPEIAVRTRSNFLSRVTNVGERQISLCNATGPGKGFYDFTTPFSSLVGPLGACKGP